MQSASPEFWDNPAEAQRLMRQMGSERNLVTTWRQLERDVGELSEMLALASQEDDESLTEEIGQELARLSAQF
ncbi:MAG: PCRF domain-containing protein, partial [Chloroflexota bacterium]